MGEIEGIPFFSFSLLLARCNGGQSFSYLHLIDSDSDKQGLVILFHGLIVDIKLY